MTQNVHNYVPDVHITNCSSMSRQYLQQEKSSSAHTIKGMQCCTINLYNLKGFNCFPSFSHLSLMSYEPIIWMLCTAKGLYTWPWFMQCCTINLHNLKGSNHFPSSSYLSLMSYEPIIWVLCTAKGLFIWPWSSLLILNLINQSIWIWASAWVFKGVIQGWRLLLLRLLLFLYSPTASLLRLLPWEQQIPFDSHYHHAISMVQVIPVT